MVFLNLNENEKKQLQHVEMHQWKYSRIKVDVSNEVEVKLNVVHFMLICLSDLLSMWFHLHKNG
jgi:hypothetical protein